MGHHDSASATRRTDLAYYSARAREYEHIYAKPERQGELQLLRDAIPACFSGRSVLEVACGTGYWTQFIARSARFVCATDLAAEPMAIAQHKGLDPSRVIFRAADALNLPADLGVFEAAFCGFWWSHIARSEANSFLDSLHARLVPGATVVLLDNLYVEGSSTPVSRRSAGGDMFQQRRLADGSSYEVLKNFPSESELRSALGARAEAIRYSATRHYWTLSYLRAA